MSMSLHKVVVTVTFSLTRTSSFVLSFWVDLNNSGLLPIVDFRFAFVRTVNLCHVTTLTEATDSPTPCKSKKSQKRLTVVLNNICVHYFKTIVCNLCFEIITTQKDNTKYIFTWMLVINIIIPLLLVQWNMNLL